MKYDFVCKSDPVSHINNRKTTTQDKRESNREHKRDSSFIASLNNNEEKLLIPFISIDKHQQGDEFLSISQVARR